MGCVWTQGSLVMMALGSLYYSNLWQNYWAKQRAD